MKTEIQLKESPVGNIVFKLSLLGISLMAASYMLIKLFATAIKVFE